MKAGWKTVKLGEAAKIISGRNQREVESPNGPHPIIGSGGEMGRANETLCPADTTVIGRKGSINRPFFMSEPFWNVDTAFGISADRGVITPRFLHYFCLSFDFTTLNKGTTIPSLVKSDIAEIPIPLPPLAEQKRIVALLDEAFAGIDEAKAKAEDALTQLKELSDSSSEVVVKEVTQNLTLRPLRDMSEGVFTGPFGTILHKHDYITGGIPLVNPAHINDEGITPGQNKTVSRETAQRLKSYLLKKGDVVIGRRGEMGRCAEITDIEDGWLCGTGSFFIRLYPTCNPKYLVILLKSRSVREKLDGMAKGATIANLGSNDLADLELPFPTMETQQNIVSRVDALNHEIRALDESLTKRAASMDTLKSSILAQAFAGELNA